MSLDQSANNNNIKNEGVFLIIKKTGQPKVSFLSEKAFGHCLCYQCFSKRGTMRIKVQIFPCHGSIFSCHKFLTGQSHSSYKLFIYGVHKFCTELKRCNSCPKGLYHLVQKYRPHKCQFLFSCSVYGPEIGDFLGCQPENQL